MFGYYKRIAAFLLFGFVGATGFATTYEVGPNKAYTSIGAVPWESLQAGDTVLINWRSTPYNEKWVICRQGTESAPIIVRGVPNSSGDLPVIDGNNATTRTALNFWGESRGVIKIGGASRPADTMPRYITVENLEIRSCRPPFTFTGYNGVAQSYVANAAALYIEKGENITVRNCILRDSAHGLFIASNDSQAAKDILIEKCYIVDNGMENDIYRHNVYTEAAGITYQFNRFGHLRAGCPGNNLKDRSAGLVVRYNWIEGGNRELDLVDATDSVLVRSDPRYAKTFVYGNVLIEPDADGNKQIVHYGGDSGQTSLYRNGVLYFYNNTVISRRTDGSTLFRFSTGNETGDLRNNIIHLPNASGSTLTLTESSLGVLYMSHNWFKTGCASCLQTSSGNLKNDGTSIAGDSPGFADEASDDFHLGVTSMCVNAGTNLLAEESAADPVTFEYVKDRAQKQRAAIGMIDIGAFESSFNIVAPTFTTQPQSQTTTEGRSVTFTANVTGSAPMKYQWLFNNQPLENATNTSLTLNPVSTNHAGNYSLVATNDGGGANSSNAVLKVNIDTSAPIAKVTFPIANATYTNQLTNSILTAQGTATDDARIQRVLFTLNSTQWQEATLSTNSTNVSWTANAPAAAGTNTFSVKAVDFHGRESATVVVKFFYNVPSALMLQTNGSGTIKSYASTIGTPTNGASLLIGRSYTLTATPAANWVHTNWTDGGGNVLATNTANLTFVMQSNLTISANFIPNPLLRFGGVYNGLFLPTENVTRDHAGFVNMTVAANSGYSGKLHIDGDSFVFSGKMRLDGTSETTIPRTRQQKPTLTLSFKLDYEGASDTLTGFVSEGTNWSSLLIADRNVWSTNNLATAFTNSFSLLFPGLTNGLGPSGYGYAVATVSTVGNVSFSGSLADGRTITQTVPVSKNGRIPFYATVLPVSEAVTNGSSVVTNVEYQEVLLGWINVNAQQASGNISWMKAAVAGDLYPQGFTNSSSVPGSLCLAPRTGVRALAITNGLMTFSGGNFAAPDSRSFTWTTNNTLVFPATNNPPKITFTVRNGTFTGTFVDPAQTNITLKISGAVLQNQNFGAGFFTGTNTSGAVQITPQ